MSLIQSIIDIRATKYVVVAIKRECGSGVDVKEG
jgi:hypothetical protein